MNSKTARVATALLSTILALGSASAFAKEKLTLQERLGNKLYHDKKLSEPNGQSCSSCHLKSAGFADPDRKYPVSEGVIKGLFGGRNSPTSSYAMYSPIFHFDPIEGQWVGGQFWDGRATGNTLGDPLADQALGPFLNPVEMANPSKTTVVRDAQKSKYKKLFNAVCGYVNLDNSAEVDAAYDCIASSIAAFERTKRFGRFTSRYDKYLKVCLERGNGTVQEANDCAKGIGPDAKKAAKKVLSKDQWKGLQLFMRPNNNDGVLQAGEGAACSACHVADWTYTSDYSLKVQTPKWAPAGMVPPVFTDFTYDNLGIPKSKHRLLVNNPVDLGLGAQVFDANENGKFKVSTLRNIKATPPYGHNGYFKSLKAITHFYNTRDTGNWPAPEVPETVNTTELGNLGLSKKQEKQLVKFMQTLTDGHFK